MTVRCYVANVTGPTPPEITAEALRDFGGWAEAIEHVGYTVMLLAVDEDAALGRLSRTFGAGYTVDDIQEGAAAS